MVNHDAHTDVDLEHMSREQLLAEVRKLRRGIRLHRGGCVRYRQSLDTQASHTPRSSQPYER
jgi:hypothetical protein